MWRQLSFSFAGVCVEAFPLATWLGRWGDEHDAYTRELVCGGWCESAEQWRWKHGGDP